MADFRVDEANLSFSGDEDASSLFITQSSFSNISTQEVDEAVDFFGGLENVSFDDKNDDKTGNVDTELASLSQKSEEMCRRVFDFTSGEKDNSWSVQNDVAPFIVTRNCDGQEFTVGNNEINVTDGQDHSYDVSDELKQDMKCFSNIVSPGELDQSKRKRFEFLTYLWVQLSYIGINNCSSISKFWL